MASLRMPFALLLAATAWAGPAPAEELGRLFHTPEKRAALSHQRQYNLRRTEVVEGSRLELNGIVRRSSGRDTVWINGVPQATGEDGGVAVSIGRDPAGATLAVGEEPAVGLKVGEAINRATRDREDGLAGGRVMVRQRP